MENQIISLLANKVVSELKNIYNNLKILSYYNSDFGNYELAIEDSEVSESDEFKAMLQKLLEKEIYEKNICLFYRKF